MPDDVKEPLAEPAEVPAEIADTEANQHEPVNPRQALEDRVIAQNAEVPEQESEETEAPVAPEKDNADEEPKPEESSNPADRIKSEMMKRVNKLTARAKSAEEELAELRAENERLKRGETGKAVTKTDTSDNAEPTMEQCEAALTKAFQDGDHKFAAQITKYMAELTAKTQREAAEKALQEKSTKQSEAQKKQLADWTALCRDYEPVDSEGNVDLKHPLNLSNQNGLLYKTALALFKDKDLNAKYAGFDPITGFRIAVNDAWRGIHEQGLYKPVAQAKPVVEVKKPQRLVLAEPDASGEEDTQASNNDANLSDAQKAQQEIRDRTKNRYKRPVPIR